MKVFIDTSAFISLFVTNETTHSWATSTHHCYQESNSFFYTNEFVLSELYTRLMYDATPMVCKKAVKAIKQLTSTQELGILNIDPHLFEKSTKAMVKFAKHKLSFTDATIYTCVKQFKLDQVFTLDSDFQHIGLTTSPSPN